MAANPPLDDWSGCVAWIVGASSGIGEATASLLHRMGCTVVVSARNAAALDGFVARHPGSMALPLDVTNEKAVADAFNKLKGRKGRLDLAMYCAGHYNPSSAASFDLAEMQRHLDVNFTGALYLLDAVLPTLMAQRHGHISLVASVAGYRGLPKATAYGPSKAALQYLAEALYLDLRPHGVGVSVINPGFVATPLTARNAFRMPALLEPEEAASHIERGWRRGQFEIHFPKRFTLWLKLLRLMPHWLYAAVVRQALSRGPRGST